MPLIKENQYLVDTAMPFTTDGRWFSKGSAQVAHDPTPAPADVPAPAAHAEALEAANELNRRLDAKNHTQDVQILELKDENVRLKAQRSHFREERYRAAAAAAAADAHSRELTEKNRILENKITSLEERIQQLQAQNPTANASRSARSGGTNPPAQDE